MKLDPSGLREPAAWEYALRFGFGGAVCAATGLVGSHYGPAIGGLCLAFPSILPASLTLVKRHDGRRGALDDAKGGRLGALGLAAFALVLVLVGDAWPAPLALVAAVAAWLAVGTAAWWLVYGVKGSDA